MCHYKGGLLYGGSAGLLHKDDGKGSIEFWGLGLRIWGFVDGWAVGLRRVEGFRRVCRAPKERVQ